MFNKITNLFGGNSNSNSNHQQQQQPQQHQQIPQQQRLNTSNRMPQMQMYQQQYPMQQQAFPQQQQMMYQQQMDYQMPAVYQLTPELEQWRHTEDAVVHAEKKETKESDAVLPKASECIDFKATFDSQPLVHLLTSQRKGLMVSVNETKMDNLDKDTCKADIICVIDVSGSMHGDKLANVKSTLNYLLEVLHGSRLAIVIFNTNASILMSFKTVNDDNIPRIKKIIEYIHELNSTNITAGVHLAQTLLGNRSTKNEVASLFLLSDGQHNQGPINNDLLFNGDFARSKAEYTLHCFGYGDDHDAKLMQSMAERKAGNYYFVNDIKRVDECFVDCLGMVTTSIASKGKITFKILPTAFFPEIRIVNTYSPYFTRVNDTTVTIDLANIYAGFKKDYVMEVELDAAKKPIEQPVQAIIAQMILEFRELGNPEVVKVEREFRIDIVPQSQAASVQTNLEVRKNFLRVLGAQTMKEAEQMRSSGKQKEAIEHLKKFKVQLASESVLAHDDLVSSLSEEMDNIIKMIENDLAGRANAFKTENFMMQQMNVYQNQCSAPIFEQKAMFANKKQATNMMNLKASKK